jgi:hypothetical protein
MKYTFSINLLCLMLFFAKDCDATAPNDPDAAFQKLRIQRPLEDRFISYTSAALEDQVHSLPGWGPLEGFNMFSG